MKESVFAGITMPRLRRAYGRDARGCVTLSQFTNNDAENSGGLRE
jgi:hypothetical protein